VRPAGAFRQISSLALRRGTMAATQDT